MLSDVVLESIVQVLCICEGSQTQDVRNSSSLDGFDGKTIEVCDEILSCQLKTRDSTEKNDQQRVRMLT